MRAELSAARSQLVESRKLASLGQLIAEVAHEISNPVSFVVGNVAPLKSKLERLALLVAARGDPEIAEVVDGLGRVIDTMARGAERTAAIVRDLRSFSRAAGDQREPCDVREVIEVSVRLLRTRWRERVGIEVRADDVPRILSNTGHLGQIFTNLISNACDACGDRGSVRVGVRRDEGFVIVTVADDGVGITQADLPRIFEPFYTTKGDGQGTGLGLPITRGLVEQHGGRIAVESVPGSGTTFTVWLPVAGNPAEQAV